MLLLIYGKDSYRVYEKIKEIKSNHKGVVLSFDKKDNLALIEKEFYQNSIFKERKLIILNQLWSLIKESKSFLFSLEKIKNFDEIVVVVKEEKIDKKGYSFFKEVFNFEPLEKADLNRWLSDRIKKEGREIEREALFSLTESIGNDLWLAVNEIDKLSAYREGVITKEDVSLLVSLKIEGDIFKAIDFLASKKTKAAFNIFYKHIKKGDHVLYLITMIAFQFRNLITVKLSRSRNSRDLGMHPFVFQKSLRLAELFSEEELRKIYKRILKAEVDIKTGKATPGAAFDCLVAGIK